MFMINKAGSLIYYKELSERAPKLDANDQMRLGSTFHGLHAIASQIAPVASAGIESLETDAFRLSCFQPQTGTKFFITAEPSTADLDAVLQRIYELFTDVVLKNPFYELEMPVRCALFDQELERLISTTTELQSQRRRGREGGQQYA